MKLISIIAILVLLTAGPVYAGSFGVSPSQVEIEVPAHGKASVEFKLYDFTGDVKISTENIPLRMSPASAGVSPANNKVTITFYGDSRAATQTYEGKILFLATSINDGISMGIKVRARVTSVSDVYGGLWRKYGLIVALAIAGTFIVSGFFTLRKRAAWRFIRARSS